jgi:hypothetical protein
MVEYFNELWEILRCTQDDRTLELVLAFCWWLRQFCRSMRTYLRVFNPLVALLIFLLCSFAAMKEDKDKPIVIGNVVAGGIPTYFFAKGMFCGVALILLGKILENQLGTGGDR